MAGELKMSFAKIENVRQIRRNLWINQNEFWSAVGVTQSGGSRYESGRSIPNAVRELIRIVHIEKISLADVKRVNMKELQA